MEYYSIAIVAISLVLLVLLGIGIFQWLWNITMPQVFGLKPIGYWVAFRLLLIAGFLTSGGFLRFSSH
jgi:hypothetical protein